MFKYYRWLKPTYSKSKFITYRTKLFVGIEIFILLATLLLPCLVKGQSNIPQPTNLKYVNDYVGVMDNNSKNYIVALGSELENKTGAQETVVIINSLEGRDIESYANELFRTWGIGQKGKDNGLLILLSITDRTWRVEVGRELEGTITDIYSARVMDNIAQNFFKGGNYSQGLMNAYATFASDIAKQYNAVLETPNINNSDVANEQRVIRINPIVIYFFLGLLALDVLFNRARVIRFILYMMFWNSFWGRGPRNGGGGFGGFGGGGGNGGFGGGTSGGGGSSGRW